MIQLDRRSFRLVVAGLSALAAAAAPRPALAQGAEASDTAHVAAEGAGGGGSGLQEGWAAPFAVESVGRPLGRDLRRVVLLADPAESPSSKPATPAVNEPVTAPENLPAEPPAESRVAATPASRPAPSRATPAPRPTRRVTGNRTHRVEWGETWYGLAREFGVSPRQLSAANPDVDPDHLRSGEVIRIPTAGAKAEKRTHRVVAGETLWGISRRYGVSAAALRSANRLPDDKVRTGQLLVIPQEGNR